MRAARDIHYIICLDFKFHKLYIVWIDGEDDDDEILVNDELKIIAFKSEIDLTNYWRQHIREQNIEQTEYSFYKLQQWLLHPHPKFDGGEFLNIWNLFIDVAVSIKSRFVGNIKEKIRDSVYDKLYAMSGLFIVEDSNPAFDEEEIDVLRNVLQQGLDLLLNNLIIVG